MIERDPVTVVKTAAAPAAPVQHFPIYALEPDGVVARAEASLAAGHRLVQLHATTLIDAIEINYTFADGSDLLTWRLAVPAQGTLASISHVYPAAFLYENEIHDLFGISFTSMSIDYNGGLYRLAVPTPYAPVKPAADEDSADGLEPIAPAPASASPKPRPAAPAQAAAEAPAVHVTEFKAKRSIVPFGPQHPVLPEPIHLDLVLEDEKVIEAIPSIGFVHRGLEKLVEKKDFQDYVYVAERICGICSFMHGMGYCQSVEGIMQLEIPSRAKYLRTLWAELSRVHSHMMWMGLMADAFGFESLFMQCWRLRELVLDLFDLTTGGRVIFSVCQIGGVRRDIDDEQIRVFRATMDQIESEFRGIYKIFFNDSSVKSRLVGVGILTPETAKLVGAVGPMLRGSGVASDTRLLGYAAYGELDFKVMTRPEGDSYARCIVRADEIFQAIDLIRQVLDRLPTGAIATKVSGTPNGEYFARLEQPRGEVLYYTRGNGSKFLQRMRVRTPTFANVPALLNIMPGCELADVPVLVLTIDPCISCTER